LNTVDQKITYAVVLTFDEKIEKVFGRLRARYLEYLNYTLVPHLTLVYPFVPVFSLFKVLEQLDAVAKRTKHFKITLNGIEFFENSNRVAYAAVQHRRAVKKLHADIIGSLDGLIKEWDTDGRFNLEKFVPHVTIGWIPAAVFADVKNRLSKYRLHYEDCITGFSLYSVENGDWQVSRVFQFTGDSRVKEIG
jgi:2'-5' RNA ligase